MKKVASALLPLAAVLAAAVPAHASVSVTLRIATANYALADVSCAVSVASGSTGGTVLQQAVSNGCIHGVTLEVFPGFGHFVQCLDDGHNGNRCGDPAPTFLRYWAMRVNCIYTDYGIDDYRAAAGSELSFTFEPWPMSSVPAVSPARGVCS